MARLDGVQRAMTNNPSPSLIQLENQLLLELDMVNGQETEMWALKARINLSCPKPKRVQSMKNRAFKRYCRGFFFFFFPFDKIIK